MNTNANAEREIEKGNPVLAGRRREYGEFSTHAQITQHLKHVIAIHRESLCLEPLHPPAQEAMDMICHKIGRISNGNPHNIDSWRDISGYALRVVEHLEAQEKANRGCVAESPMACESKAIGCGSTQCPAANIATDPFIALADTLGGIAAGLSYDGPDMEGRSKHRLLEAVEALYWLNRQYGVGPKR